MGEDENSRLLFIVLQDELIFSLVMLIFMGKWSVSAAEVVVILVYQFELYATVTGW